MKAISMYCEREEERKGGDDFMQYVVHASSNLVTVYAFMKLQL
jgi:hypothetical protein